jgi:hypothetical protein
MFVDWADVEQTWFEAAVDAIVTTSASNPAERLYAGAFWLLYGDYTSLLAPAFGLNSESSVPEVRWHPPDWRWATIDRAHQRLQPLYQPLQHLQVEKQHYETLWQQHIDALARAPRRVTELARSNQLQVGNMELSPRFFVGIIDFSHGDAAWDYLRRSVDEETISSSGLLEWYR